MFETQTVLVIVIVVLTILLSVIGFQLFLILREFQKSIQKVNKMLDDFGIVSGSFAGALSGIGETLSGFSGLAGLLSIFKKRKQKSEKAGEKE